MVTKSDPIHCNQYIIWIITNIVLIYVLPLLQDLMRFWIPSTMHLTVFCKHNAYIYIGNFYVDNIKEKFIYAIEKTDAKCYKNAIKYQILLWSI